MSGQANKILVVDDEEDIVIGTQELLEHRGYQVLTALDSDSALSIFQKERPSILILDVHMPKSRLDGNGILEEVRKIDKDCFCIMLSRVDDKEKIEQARRLSANRYVLKPINFSELLDLIKEAEETLERQGVKNG